MDRHSRHHFRTHPLIDFARIRSVDATLTDYWHTGSGRQYLESQRSGIAAGDLEVTRVFVLARDSLANAREPEIFTTEERQVAHAEEVVEFLAQYANDIDDIYS